MRRFIIYITFGLLTLVFLSCEDYLDMKDSDIMTGEQVFGDPVLFRKFKNDIYCYMYYNSGGWGCYSFGGFGRVGGAWFEGATDLAESSSPGSGTNASFNQGNWAQTAYGASVELTNPWEGAYAAIRRCNVVLEKVDSVPGLDSAEIKFTKSEALFLRAFFYFELIKRYGGVPYITRSLGDKENMNYKREPYDTCVAKIVKDLDASLLNLPTSKSQKPTDLGRPTLGAALALKAKVLLYAASPLNTEAYNVGSSDTSLFFVEQPNTAAEIQEMWIKAANAAYEVIKLAEEGQYKLSDSAKYQNVFIGIGTDQSKNEEIIYSRIDGSFSFGSQKRRNGDMVYGNQSTSKSYGGSVGTYPTQNFVDLCEMKDGSAPITGYNSDGSPIINTATGYNDQNMWENRDPRLKLTILRNQDFWQDRKVEIWFDKNDHTITGVDVKNAQDYTSTGYLARKIWPEQLKFNYPTLVTANWIWFRLTDVFLWYAESMNQAFGPDADGLGNGLNARKALDSIRNRLNPSKPHMRDVKAFTKEEFHERLMNERAIEFIYEEQRWWDVIRYKKGNEIFNSPIYGINVYRTSTNPLNFEIQRKKIEDRVFRDFMHKYPIPFTEIEKSSNLKQNPGW